jgi:starch phosphorylase
MKALLNGVPNLSVLDGWWIEGYHAANGDAANGWAIGEGFNGGDEDEFDANSLYGLLESEILPEFYERPEAWTARMQRAIATAPDFTSQRMVRQYATEMYGL